MSTTQKSGETGLLLRLLESHFGPLPEETLRRVHDASSDQIHSWTIRAIDASTLADVFSD